MTAILTSESVTRGHPDKVCDQIGDAILDEYLKNDRNSRVAMEVMATPETVVISGEVNSRAEITSIDRKKIVRDTIKEIGYNAENGYDPEALTVIDLVGKQSTEISEAVNKEVLGAGDQGIMFGYATNETPEYLPLSLAIARDITNALTISGPALGLRPDGKSQVTAHDESSPVKLTILVSSQHNPGLTIEKVRANLKKIIKKVVENRGYSLEDTKLILQPAGLWVQGGPASDVGVLGRKIIVDSYGGAARHGGGAYSGKDPSKVDRSGAYAARQAALWLVKNGYASKAEVQLSYAIGKPSPVSVMVETFGTGRKTDKELAELIQEKYDFTVQGIIDRLDLTSQEYRPFAARGHFGNGGSWEEV